MAKIEKSTVSVKNVDTGAEVSVNGTQTPRKTEVGLYFVPKLNQLGIAYLQRAHPEITSSALLEAYLASHFGIPAEEQKACFGTLAPWKTAEDKAKWEVSINGNPFVGNVALQTTETVTTPVAMEPVVMEPLVVADTSDTAKVSDTENVNRIVEAQKQGVDLKEIQAALLQQKGASEAQRIMALVNTQPSPEPVISFK